MINPTFTFIVPVHNGIKYIKECIDSLLAQEYQNFDIIILENASNDGTKEYLEGLKNDKIKIIPSDKLLSIEENWARIINAPRQEFMVLACADDYYAPNFLGEIIKLIQKHPNASLYRTHFNIIDENNKILAKSYEMNEQINENDYLKGVMLQTYSPSVVGYAFKSSDYDKVGGIDCVNKLAYSDDVLFMKLIKDSFLVTSPKIACSYRHHNETTSNNTNSSTVKNAFIHFFSYIHSLNNKKLNTTVKKYLAQYFERVKVSYNEADFEEIKKINELFKTKPSDIEVLLYKLKEFFDKHIYIKNIDNTIRIKFFSIKTRIKLKKSHATD